MMEKPNFESQILPEGEKAPYRVLIEEEREANKELKSDAAKLAALAAERLSDAALKD